MFGALLFVLTNMFITASSVSMSSVTFTSIVMFPVLVNVLSYLAVVLFIFVIAKE